jgi:DNA-sulfur modification-associated
MPFVLRNAAETFDGGRICYDVVSTAAEIHRAFKQGFLQIDDERQRGKNTVTGNRIRDEKKIDQWAEKLVADTGYLGQLTWNIRKETEGDPELEYDAESRMLTINALSAFLPDSYHRTNAVVKAVDSIARGSSFDKNRKISVRIYNAPAHEENDIFYAYNQEGKPADQGRSKWLRPHDAAIIARRFVAESPHLGDENVDTFQDRLSKKSYRLASFGTIAKAIETGWAAENADDPAAVDAAVAYLVSFWDKLVEVRPELGKLPLAARQQIRETMLVDGALSLTSLLKLAYRMYKNDVHISVLERLGEKTTDQIDFFSRQNPTWKTLSILVPEQGKGGKTVFTVRNIRQTREAMYKEICVFLGLERPAELEVASTNNVPKAES